jgi:histidine triad (HIT) family protein
MSASNCIFCKIIAGEIPAKVLYRDNEIVAIEDVNPQAPHHVLVMPVRHSPNIVEYAGSAPPAEVASLLGAAARIGGEWGGGFRIVVNTGPEGGQTVDHLHLHLLGGRRMVWPPG